MEARGAKSFADWQSTIHWKIISCYNRQVLC